MKTLAIFDRKDYDITHPRFVKKASRAIIIVNSKIPLLYSNKYKIYPRVQLTQVIDKGYYYV
jgi:hypothetical protein